MILSRPIVDSYIGKHIDEICPNKFKADNHCAHFVSHVLQMDFGYTCGAGANVRVAEVFERCPWIEEVNSCPPRQSDCLIFVTGVNNVGPGTPSASGVRISNVPKKHVGILMGGDVVHYSNSHHKVMRESATIFFYHYPKQSNGLWCGGLPPRATAAPFGSCSR